MSELKNIPCAVRGFHYYRRYWTPYLGEELICQHDDSNPFDIFAIKTCSQENGGSYRHLPKEISRATKFLINRGALVFVEVSSNHYCCSLQVQGGLEIPCRLSVKLAVATIKNNMLVDRYRQILEELYEEPSEEIIMGSILLDYFEEVSDIEDETNVGETAMPQNRKRKPDKVNKKTSKTSNKEPDQPNCSRRNDIRTFFKALPKKKYEEEQAKKRKKSPNVIVIE